MPIEVAVIGQTGSGKSTFINTFVGLDDGEDGAAPIHNIDDTCDRVMKHKLPGNNMYTFNDFPGVGSNFRLKTYLSTFEYNAYDFFIIICSDRFGVVENYLI